MIGKASVAVKAQSRDVVMQTAGGESERGKPPVGSAGHGGKTGLTAYCQTVEVPTRPPAS